MALSLHDMLVNLFGIGTYERVNPVTDASAAAAAVVAHANPMRAMLLIVNLSANNVYIAPDNQVAADHGIYIAPNGGSVLLQWDRDFELCAREWWIISPAGASDIFVIENILD